jgi:hypothetical protein
MRRIFASMLNCYTRIINERDSGSLGAAMIDAVSLRIAPIRDDCALA